MAVEDIKLRQVANAPLTTKGSQLTWEELDGNFIQIFNAFMLNYLSSYVDAYNNAATYDNAIANYATYNSVTWKYINAAPSVGVTPGTDAATWVRVFTSDLAHKKNSDTMLAEGTDDEVSAADLALLINTGSAVFEFEFLITADKVATMFSNPVPIFSHPGGVYAGKKIKLISIEAENVIEDSPASTPYTSNYTISIATDTATRTQFVLSNCLNATVRRTQSGSAQGISTATDTQLIADKSIYASRIGDDATGDYDVLITGSYKYI